MTSTTHYQRFVFLIFSDKPRPRLTGRCIDIHGFFIETEYHQVLENAGFVVVSVPRDYQAQPAKKQHRTVVGRETIHQQFFHTRSKHTLLSVWERHARAIVNAA